MQNYCKTIGAIATATALVAGTALAEVEYEIHAGYSSEYIFRGVEQGDDLVEVGVDMATEWNGLGLSAGAWYGSFSNSSAAAPAGQVQLEELDIYGEVSKDLGFATLGVGYIYCMNDSNLGDDAQEVYFSLSREFFGIDASLTYFADIETDNDGYLELGLSKGFELSPCLTLNTGAAFGYLAEQGQLGHITARVALDWAFTETATLSPFVAHTWSTGDDNDTAYQNTGNEFIAGTMLSVSF